MSTFNARLRLSGRSKLPLGVEVDIRHERMTLTSGDRTVAVWPLVDLDVVYQPDGFHMNMDGEEIVLNVIEATRFAAELGISQRPRITAPAQPIANSNGKVAPSQAVAEPSSDLGQLERVRRRVSEITEALTSDAVTPAEAFGEWLRLLKEINRRHGQGSMSLDLFYQLNTQMLDLIPEPALTPTTEELTHH